MESPRERVKEILRSEGVLITEPLVTKLLALYVDLLWEQDYKRQRINDNLDP